MPGYKRPPDGYVSMARIADRLDVDRRVLKRPYEGGEIEGMPWGGMLCLERRSLAAYLWSQPRCVEAGCGRRVIGPGPGCHLHRRSGRHHSEETKRKMSETQREGPPVQRVCEWCSEPFEVSPGEARSKPTRFCGRACTRASLNREPDADGRHQHGPAADVIGYIDMKLSLREGNSKLWARVKRVKKERGLLGVEDLVDRPADEHNPFRAGLLRKAGVPRSIPMIRRYIRIGWLEPERDLGFKEPLLLLFTQASVDKLIAHLRADPDGRVQRFTRISSRLDAIQSLHGPDARVKENGRFNVPLAAAKGKKVGAPRGLDEAGIETVRELYHTKQWSQQAIADHLGVSRMVVRYALRP